MKTIKIIGQTIAAIILFTTIVLIGLTAHGQDLEILMVYPDDTLNLLTDVEEGEITLAIQNNTDDSIRLAINLTHSDPLDGVTDTLEYYDSDEPVWIEAHDAIDIIYYVNPNGNIGIREVTVCVWDSVTGMGTQCKDLIINIQDDFMSVGESNKEIVNIYPNPTSDYITIEGIGENEIAVLADMAGKIISVYTVSNGDILRMEHLETGTYFLNLLGKTHKIIKA